MIKLLARTVEHAKLDLQKKDSVLPAHVIGIRCEHGRER